MHKHLTVLVSVLLVCFLTISAFAWGEAASSDTTATAQTIRFCAACSTLDDVKAAREANADFISISGDKLSLQEALNELDGNIPVILDAEDTAQADALYKQVQALEGQFSVYYRLHFSSSKAQQWLREKNGVNVIGCYKGNVYFSAVNYIRGYASFQALPIVEMQTGNPFGVVLHNSVAMFFDRSGVCGMFSFTDSTLSAARTDTFQSWDDLIERGYSVIETSYPADFAEYLKQNTAERSKLSASVTAANAISTNSCPSNRVKDYNKALDTAKELLVDGSSSSVSLTKARIVLDLAVKNITVRDGKQIKGDFAVTVGRIIAAAFGIALVVAMQLWFRSRWGKKKTK